jgi:hypothetical protein
MPFFIDTELFQLWIDMQPSPSLYCPETDLNIKASQERPYTIITLSNIIVPFFTKI